MNSYFDDYQPTSTPGPAAGSSTATATATTPAPDQIDEKTIDSDLSKLFEQSDTHADSAAPAVNSVVKPPVIEDAAGPIKLEPDLTIDEPTPKADFVPEVTPPALKEEVEPIKEETTTKDASDYNPKPKFDKPEVKPTTNSDSSGSLSETEKRLADRKDELAAQISETEAKLKKIEDTLAKIGEVKKQEADIMKLAEEI